jgi:predicted kinase
MAAWSAAVRGTLICIMHDRYVFVLLGYLGSGKSYVSRWLSPHVQAVYLRVDELRLAMFGQDRPELYTPQNKSLVNNASRYVMLQILGSGQANVVHDANHNARSLRAAIAHDASKCKATAIVVWVQTPLDASKRRTEVRAVTEGHQLFEPGLVEKMAKQLEEPADDELVIILDGQTTAAEQQQSFDAQFAAIKARLGADTQ